MKVSHRGAYLYTFTESMRSKTGLILSQHRNITVENSRKNVACARWANSEWDFADTEWTRSGTLARLWWVNCGIRLLCLYNSQRRVMTILNIRAIRKIIWSSSTSTFQVTDPIQVTRYMVPWWLSYPLVGHCDTPTRTIQHCNDSPHVMLRPCDTISAIRLDTRFFIKGVFVGD